MTEAIPPGPDAKPWRKGLPDWASDDWINAAWVAASESYYKDRDKGGSPVHEFVRAMLAAAPTPLQAVELMEAIRGDIESVTACLGDDAAQIRSERENGRPNGEGFIAPEWADTMDAAADLIRDLAARALLVPPQKSDQVHFADNDGQRATVSRTPINYRDSWQRLTDAEFQEWAARGQELQRAVRAMTAVLSAGEWAEHVSGDSDIAALEFEITKLVGLAAPPSAKSLQPLLDAHRDVLAERQRQIEDEGWTPEHDSDHDPGDLAAAAACYATGVPDAHTLQYSNGNEVWPWAPGEFRPGRAVDRSLDGLGPVSRIPDFRRDLIRAGALILAEIERIDRAALRASSAPTTKG